MDIKIWKSVFKDWMKKEGVWDEFMVEVESYTEDIYIGYNNNTRHGQIVGSAFSWTDSSKGYCYWRDIDIKWRECYEGIKPIPDTKLARKLYKVYAEIDGKLIVNVL